MLLPGYILTLDMVFTPEIKALFSGTNYNNALPFYYILHFVSGFIPAWIIQKIILFILFFGLGYFSYKFLPLSENKTVRIFSALLYTVNPFVYSRFLAGHWTHLMAYALLPVFVHWLLKFTKSPSFKSSIKLFVSILLISLFSLHFFTMLAVIMAVWFLVYAIKYLAINNLVLLKLTFKNLLCGVSLFLILGSYWLIPVIVRGQAFEQRFDRQHWLAFAASGHDKISTTVNILSLNGFWAENQPWSRQFAWPQDYQVFWLALIIIWFLILIGVIYGFKNKDLRPRVIFFSTLGILAFVFSTGAGDTVFKNFNISLYEHVPFWRGFRDSQKFVGLLALSYAVLSGIGLGICIEWLQKKKEKFVAYFPIVILFVPVLFGYLLWGGFRNQVRAVWYPEAWYQAKNIIQVDNSDYHVLFLPWHGYLSLNFNANLLVANPAKRFFGTKAVVSKSVELEGIYDQELNAAYLQLDQVIKNGQSLVPNEMIDYFEVQDIKYIIYFQDLNSVDNLHYEFLASPRLKMLINDAQLQMYQIEVK